MRSILWRDDNPARVEKVLASSAVTHIQGPAAGMVTLAGELFPAYHIPRVNSIINLALLAMIWTTELLLAHSYVRLGDISNGIRPIFIEVVLQSSSDMTSSSENEYQHFLALEGISARLAKMHSLNGSEILLNSQSQGILFLRSLPRVGRRFFFR
jgi:hypothetical protein